MKKLTRQNKLPLLGILLLIVLNSFAVWAFSFLCFWELAVIYLVNTLPFVPLFLLMRQQKGERSGIPFLYFIAGKLLYFLLFFAVYDYWVGVSRNFLLNFTLVYVFFLYFTIFVEIRFLSKKIKD